MSISFPDAINDITITDVDRGASDEWSQIPDTTKQQMLQEAKELAMTTYGGQVSRLPTQTNQKLFVINLARHFLEEVEGGEAQSESQQGGSTSYNTVTGDAMSSLQSTRYGRRCTEILRAQQSVGIVRTRR